MVQKSHALLLFLCLVVGSPGAESQKAPANSSATNWTLQLSANNGAPLAILRGNLAQAASRDRIEVVDFSITVYSADSPEHIETILYSPFASFDIQRNCASGANSVRAVQFNRNDEISAQITGEGWRYDTGARKLFISRNVRNEPMEPLGAPLSVALSSLTSLGISWPFTGSSAPEPDLPNRRDRERASRTAGRPH